MPRNQYVCVLCKGRTKPKERRSVNKHINKILEKRFCTHSETTNVICNKCRHKCRVQEQSKIVNKRKVAAVNQSPDVTQGTKHTMSSPPSVTLSFPTTTRSHAFCFVCKKPGPKLITVSSQARLRVFIEEEIIVPSGARCCPGHFDNDMLTPEAMSNIPKCSESIFLNRTTICDFIKGLRNLASQRDSCRLSFDDELSDEDYMTLTGISRYDFDDINSHISDIKSSKSRSVRDCIGILLVKLRCGMSNKMLAVLFRMTKFQIRRAIQSARTAMMSTFVPENLGFNHVSREEVIQTHTRPLAKELFASDITENPAILVLDGTYIYVQKSCNFSFSRRSYSMHKHRPLVKPMMVVSTTGYIVSVLGPYLADSKNNDANILKHMVKTNSEEIKQWIKEQDVFVVDRGFRDAADVLSDLGIKMEMPAFLQRGDKQHSTEEANSSRLVTKIRWIVEAVNGRLKNWRYLDKTLPNSQIPHIRDYVCIISAMCNKYRPPMSCGTLENDQVLAAKMLYLSKQSNQLQIRVIGEGLDKRSRKWKKVDSSDVALSFPVYDKDQLRQLTLGVYQIKMAKSYTQEHLDDDGKYEIMINEDVDGILCAKLQSRHISAKQYLCWIGYEEGNITGWYCKCKAGCRVVGTCGHITSIIWYLAHARHDSNSTKGVRNWSETLADAGRLPDVIDESEDEVEGQDDNVDVMEE